MKKRKMSFDVIVGYDKETHVEITMDIKEVLKKYPNIKTIEELNEVLQKQPIPLFK